MTATAVRDGWRLAVGTLTALPTAPPERVDTTTARTAILLAPLAVAPLGVVAALLCLLPLPDPAVAEAAQLAAASAKVAVDRFSYATAAKLFDVGGASATQRVHNLDRHWRNARVASTHNPTFLKASAIGDHLVNGASFPGNAYF